VFSRRLCELLRPGFHDFYFPKLGYSSISKMRWIKDDDLCLPLLSPILQWPHPRECFRGLATPCLGLAGKDLEVKDVLAGAPLPRPPAGLLYAAGPPLWRNLALVPSRVRRKSSRWLLLGGFSVKFARFIPLVSSIPAMRVFLLPLSHSTRKRRILHCVRPCTSFLHQAQPSRVLEVSI